MISINWEARGGAVSVNPAILTRSGRFVCPRAENDSPDVPLHVGGMAPGLQGHDFIDLFGDIEQAGFVFQDQSNGADRLRVTAVIARNAKGAAAFPG